MASLIIYCSTCRGDLKSTAFEDFSLEDYTDHQCTLEVHPSFMYTAISEDIPNSFTTELVRAKEICETYYNMEDKDFLSGSSHAWSWICYMFTAIHKSIAEGRKFVKIYYPETFLDNDWTRKLWNILCNVAKSTKLSILVYTHLPYHLVYDMNYENDIEETRVRLYTGYEDEEGLGTKICNWIIKSINRLKNKLWKE